MVLQSQNMAENSDDPKVFPDLPQQRLVSCWSLLHPNVILTTSSQPRASGCPFRQNEGGQLIVLGETITGKECPSEH